MKIPVYDLSYEQQRSIHNALAESTIGHIGKNQGLFEKLEFDSVANPSQDLRNVFLPSVTTSPEEVDDLEVEGTLSSPPVIHKISHRVEEGADIFTLSYRGVLAEPSVASCDGR